MSLADFLYLSRADVEGLGLGIADVAPVVRRVFEQKGRGEVESPPKRGIVPANGCSIRSMMAHVPSLDAAGVKWISAFPSNAREGTPTITGLVILNDVSTGFPVAVLDASWITATRTAASTLLAAQFMARPASSTAGVVACGLQGRINLEALCAHFPITHVKAYDLSADAARAFAETMGAHLGVEIEIVDTAAACAEDVDILVTSMPIVRRPQPPIDAGAMRRGTFAALLDYNSALTIAGFREADKVIVDDHAQLRFFRSIGYFRGVPEPDGDLGKVAAGRQRGRDHDDQVVIGLNLGIGVLDVATAELVVRTARERGVGTSLPL